MEFLVIAYDGKDDRATERRLAARPAHLDLVKKFAADGKFLYGTAILDDGDMMIGTSLVCDFPSRAELDAWLEVEPYVTGKVWQRIEVHRCKSGSAFGKKATT
jgi:uncharacterized protein